MENLELTQEDNARIFKSILEKLKNIGYPILDSETFESKEEPKEPYGNISLTTLNEKKHCKV